MLIENNSNSQAAGKKVPNDATAACYSFFSHAVSIWLSCFHYVLNTQNEIETLKAENDRLKSSGNATPTATPVKTARPPSETSSTSSSSSRQSLGLSLNNLNISDTMMSGQFSVCASVQKGQVVSFEGI